MDEHQSETEKSLERIATALESIALFLQVLVEDQSPVDEQAPSGNVVVMTQHGPMELR